MLTETHLLKPVPQGYKATYVLVRSLNILIQANMFCIDHKLIWMWEIHLMQ